MAKKEGYVCLLVKLTVILSLMDAVAWVCPNCLSAQQCVFILSWPLARDTHSSSGPLVQSYKTMQSCWTSSETRCHAVPWGWSVFDKSEPNLFPALNRFFVAPSLWMSVRLSCGSMDSSRSDTLHGFRQDSNSAARLPLNHNRSSFILQQCFAIKWNLLSSSLMEHEIQDFILALAGIKTPDLNQALLIKSSKWCNASLRLLCASMACFST